MNENSALSYLQVYYHYPQQESQHLLQSSSQQPQFFLNDDMPTFDSQDSFVYSIQQQNSFMSDILTINTTEDDISSNIDMSEIDQDGDQLNIAPGLPFKSWEQLDRHIQIYAKQNSFVTIILESESDDITRRRCRYACEHQGTGHSKKTVILEQQKQSRTK
ncbi:16865_t:CDS:1 [Dentiscutata erythropus]|uniref:16865_t:CDS:1 n=1 Tax=Dentiscutata erythropus TaxID=1348616 RepID=A0A9N9CUC9_9GLOM|nr:16865_t:CDS:1 [Dentiscutata erythropus]